jgi:signal peptidase II
MSVGAAKAREANAAPSGQHGVAQPPALRPRQVRMLASVAAVALTLDVLTKVLVVATLQGRDPVELLGGLVYLQLVRNPGAAFGMATGMTWVLALVAIAVVATIGWLAGKLRSRGWAVGLGLVLAGALGNLVDRFFRAPGPFRGHVVDFISVFSPDGDTWPVFNVADSAIVLGGILIVVLSLMGKDYDGTSDKDPGRRPASHTGGHG